MSLKKICYKSGLMFVIFITTSAMLILLTNSITYHLKDSKPFSFLSKDYVLLQTLFADDETNSALISSIDDYSDASFAAEDYSSHGGFAIWFDEGYETEFATENGRFFETSDFEKRSNVAVVNIKADNDIIERDGDRFLIMDDKEYLIIGEFSAPQSNYRNKWYISLASENLKNDTVTGTIIFDGRDNIYEYANNICEDISQRNMDANVGFEPNRGALGTVLSDVAYKGVLVLYLLLIFLVFINTFAVASTWINSRRMELSVRCMCGAEKKNVICDLILEYYVIIDISFVAGLIIDIIFMTICDFTPIRDTIGIMFGEHIYLMGAAAGLVLVLVSGIIPVLSKLGDTFHQEIAEGLS